MLVLIRHFKVDNKNPPQENLFSIRHVANLVLVSLAVMLHAADATSVATLVPAIVQDIGGVELIPWAVSLYEIGTIVVGVACGFLATNYGIRKPMLVATLSFFFGCMTSFLAIDMWVVLLGRLFQGLGGGGLAALSFVAVNLLFHRSLIPRALAVVSVIWGSSAFIGPLIGGLFVEYLNWRYAFLFFAFMSFLLACILLLTVKDEVRPKESQTSNFPILRLLMLTVGVVCIAYAGVNISIIKTLLFVILGIAILAFFLRVDSISGDSRLLPRNPITLSSRVGAGLTMILCFTISTIAITVYGPYFVTKIHDSSLLVGGYIVACSSVGWSIAAIIFSNVDEKNDHKMVVSGMIILTISIIGFIFSVPGGPIWLVAFFAFLEGAGFGMAYAFILRLMSNASDEAEIERVSAAGVANAIDQEAIANVAFWIFASCLPIALLGLVAAVRFVKKDGH